MTETAKALALCLELLDRSDVRHLIGKHDQAQLHKALNAGRAALKEKAGLRLSIETDNAAFCCSHGFATPGSSDSLSVESL